MVRRLTGMQISFTKSIQNMNNTKLLYPLIPIALLGCDRGRDTGGGDGVNPNIIFFFVDDMGWKDTGFMGSSYYETPNIDRMAGKAAVFTNAYSNAPNCAPSRACLLTGKYSPHHGVYTVGSSERGRSENRKLIPTGNKTVLDTSFVTVAEKLQEHGYKTISLGKYHLGSDAEGNGPLSQGFGINVGGGHEGLPPSYFYPWCNRDSSWCLPALDRPEKGDEYLTGHLTEEAVEFMEKNHDGPFFMYFPHYAVHTPLQARDSLIEKYRNKTGDRYHNHPVYAAMIESVDRSFRKICRTLKDLDIENNTIIIFFSDNGGLGTITSMHPLRGSKGMLYEGGIRVPCFIRWPGMPSSGKRIRTPVVGTDFYPTLLEMAGLEKPDDPELDGVSLVPLLKETGTLPERNLYWHFPAYLQASGHLPFIWRTTPGSVIRSGKYKLIEYFEDGHLELYNLEKDTGETVNLAESMPEKAEELHRQLREWRKNTGAPVPSKTNPRHDPRAAGNKTVLP